MDVVSYLLGKNASGGGGSGNNAFIDTSMTYNTNSGIRSIIKSIDMIDTSSFTSFQYCFDYFSGLTTIPLIDTSSATQMNYMFRNCDSLVEIPQLDTSNCQYMLEMFNGCSHLTTVPILNTSNLKQATAMFKGCNSLSDQSLNNILKMCINAVSFTQTKKLTQLGITSSNYPATRIQGLSNYQDFIDAGWTIGY